MYGKSLKTELQGELSSHFLKICKRLILPIPHVLAKEVKRAFKVFLPKSLIEIFIGLDNAQLCEMKKYYKLKFNTTIERDLGQMQDVNVSFKRLALAILQGNRNESKDVDEELAIQDARELYSAGTNRFGTDDPVFNELMASRSYDHLKVVFAKYRVEAHEDIGQSIRFEFQGSMQEIYMSIVEIIRKPAQYFAETLLRVMKGVGTDDAELVRIVVWRSEIDLEEIKGHFSELNGRTLQDYIRADTGGDFRTMLLAIVK